MRYIFGKKELIWRWIFAQTMIRHGARIYERLSDHWQTGIHGWCFVDVEYEVWIFNEIHPKS